MIHFKRNSGKSLWILAVLLFFGVQTGWCQGKQQGGLSNFARVADTLYRGAQPSAAGFAALKSMGIGMVVNFRDDGEAASEKREVESLGMKYVAIPWSGSQNPSDKQIVQFLNLVRDNPNVKIFVHCRRGADRTGTMVAAYRVAVEHQSTTQAVAEMHQFHYAKFWLPQLERYVVSLPQLMETDPQFSSYALTTSPRTSSASVTTAAAAVPVAIPVPALP